MTPTSEVSTQGASAAPEQKPTFNVAAEFVLKVPGTAKTCTMRFGSDADWCGWARKQTSIKRNIGRGNFRYDPVNAAPVNAELFSKLRVDADGQQLDAAEIASIIGRLQRAQVLDAEQEGAQYRLTIGVLGASTVHVLRAPRVAETDEYENASVSVLHGTRSQQIRTFLDPVGPLYDALHISHEGYAAAVPIVHKAAAVAEVLRLVSQGIEEDDVPEL
jgi:hypothetical protein